MDRKELGDRIWQIFLDNGISPDAGDPLGAIEEICDLFEKEVKP